MPNKYLDFYSHTPSLDTSAYADGDLLADVEELPRFFPGAVAGVTITDLVVFDKSDQGVAFDIYFTQSSTTWGTENDALSITDAIADDIVGKIAVVAADFDDFINSQVAFKHDLSVSIPHVEDSRSIYVALVSRGTGTYAADGLTLKFGIEQE